MYAWVLNTPFNSYYMDGLRVSNSDGKIYKIHNN